MQITKDEIKRVVSNVQNYTLAKKYLKAADIESIYVMHPDNIMWMPI